MVRSVSVFFDIVYTYSCSSNKGDFLELEKKMLPKHIKGISKGIDATGFGIVEYSVRSESGNIIALRDLAYYVPVLHKYFGLHFPTRYSHIRSIQG